MTETIKELICICCPKGCHLRVDTANDYAVTGNACPNGAAYGKEELTHPTRIITSTVRITGGLYPALPGQNRAGGAKGNDVFRDGCAEYRGSASPRAYRGCGTA